MLCLSWLLLYVIRTETQPSFLLSFPPSFPTLPAALPSRAPRAPVRGEPHFPLTRSAIPAFSPSFRSRRRPPRIALIHLGPGSSAAPRIVLVPIILASSRCVCRALAQFSLVVRCIDPPLIFRLPSRVDPFRRRCVICRRSCFFFVCKS